MNPNSIRKIFKISDEKYFRETALEIFRYQASHNPVYKDFVKQLGIEKDSVASLSQVPFLPVEFFKKHKIVTGDHPGEVVFESSGTTGLNISRHYVSDVSLYEESFLTCFQLFYNNPENYFIAALLPSYTERESSSLVYMVKELIKRSRNPLSGFYNANTPELILNIKKEKRLNQKILLIGVSFTLLDLAEQYSPDLSGVIVMETGGMKGRRKEITRRELHLILKKGLNITEVHSEYGMTELLSQAYSKGNEIFHCPPWMKILVRDPRDPLSIINGPGITGGINIIDLANINSCSFIATGDLGKLHYDGGFEVLGRFDNSDIRGCNLLIE
jgi:phenylacetate-coenzyme A ligase PaaK-like adenylate-forming protein